MDRTEEGGGSQVGELTSGALRVSKFIIKMNYFQHFDMVWHVGRFGSMENTSPRRDSDVPKIIGFLKNVPKWRSVNICFQRLDLDPDIRCFVFTSQSSAHLCSLIPMPRHLSHEMGRFAMEFAV